MVLQGEPPIIGLSEDTLTDIPRTGRRKMDAEPLTFPIAVSKIAIWGIGLILTVDGILTGWLCIQSMQHGNILVRMDERDKAVRVELQNLHDSDITQQLANARMALEIKEIQLQQASHGWNRGK